MLPLLIRCERAPSRRSEFLRAVHLSSALPMPCVRCYGAVGAGGKHI